MKKLKIILPIVLTLTGCNLDSIVLEEDTVFYEEGYYTQSDIENADPLENYSYLDESLKIQLRELYDLWKRFDNGKDQNIDPTEDFHNSEYIAVLKNFLSQRESLTVSDNDLIWILEQYGLESINKSICLSNGKEYNIRVINYNVDYYVQAITDAVGLRNKWVFVQCWNEDEFYFTVISDGDIHTIYDFFPLEIDGVFHIILTGTSFPSYPQPPFLWAWHLEVDGFYQGALFDFQATETDKYFVYDSIDFNDNRCMSKWTVQTDGSFVTLEKCDIPEGDSWPDYFDVYCESKDEGKTFTFTSLDNLGKIDSTIKISLVRGQFAIE